VAPLRVCARTVHRGGAVSSFHTAPGHGDIIPPMSPRHRSGSVGRYLLAALIAGSIPVVVGVNGCDSNPVVQPDGSVPSDGGSAGKGGGAVGGQAGLAAGSGGAGGQAGSAAGSGGAGGQAGRGSGSGGAGGQAGSAAGSGGAGGQAGSASHSGGAGGVGGAGGQGGRGGSGGAGGAPSQACLYAGALSVEPVAGACCAVGVGSIPRFTKCTSDHMSLGTCFRSSNYEYLWQVQACPCTDGQGGAGGGSYCN